VDAVAALEKGLAFLKAHEWGQGADRQECSDGYAYCARGALIYGAFADQTEYSWCPEHHEWHKGACIEDGEFCGNADFVLLAEFADALDALDEGAEVVAGRQIMAVEYNDATCRTKDDVISMFEAAIRKLQEHAE